MFRIFGMNIDATDQMLDRSWSTKVMEKLKTIDLPDDIREKELFNLRPEQISVAMFVELVQEIEALES